MTRKIEVETRKGGCFSCLALIFLVWAILFGLPTPWGVLDLDIFPPGIYLRGNRRP